MFSPANLSTFMVLKRRKKVLQDTNFNIQFHHWHHYHHSNGQTLLSPEFTQIFLTIYGSNVLAVNRCTFQVDGSLPSGFYHCQRYHRMFEKCICKGQHQTMVLHLSVQNSKTLFKRNVSNKSRLLITRVLMVQQNDLYKHSKMA